MKLTKNIFITILVLTGTLLTPKSHSKSIFSRYEFEQEKCSSIFEKNFKQINHQNLNHSKSENFTWFFLKNNLGKKIKLRQLASDLDYKSLVRKLDQTLCNYNSFGGYQNQVVEKYPFYGDGENCDQCQLPNYDQHSKIINEFSSVAKNSTSDPQAKSGNSISKEISVAEKNSLITANKEIELIAKTIWGEGRGESYEGKVAIGNVILNRYKISQATKKSHWWGNTIEQIILHPYQFSCHNHNDPNKTKIAKLTLEDAQYRESLKIAKGILSGVIKDNTRGATHYFAYKVVRPRWASKMNKTKRIGNHDFYRN